VSRYQKGKTNLDFTEARGSEWQWHQLGHMQVCTSLQTDNHASIPPLSYLQAGCPSCRPTNSVKALKAVPKVTPSKKSQIRQCKAASQSVDVGGCGCRRAGAGADLLAEQARTLVTHLFSLRDLPSLDLLDKVAHIAFLPATRVGAQLTRLHPAISLHGCVDDTPPMITFSEVQRRFRRQAPVR